MVKVKEASTFAVNEDQTVESWLQHLKDKGYEHHREQIQYAFELVKLSGQEFAIETGETCFKHGLAMAEIVADLGMDLSSVLAALLFSSVQYAELSLDLIEEELGADIARLIKGVMRMNTLSMAPSLAKISQKKSQLDNWRKMLLAMADDVRVVLIKLADRLCVLRATAHLPETIRRQLAQEAMNVYAPLAHRLGIGAIKWELEDLAFRYLHPDDYKTIAKGLRAKRLERDRYVNWIVEQLQMHIKHLGMKHYSIYGRSKHIHSIYNKMKRKKVPLDEIYDATAVRILVDTTEQCYDVLGMVHALWAPIPKEFDDFITHPKPNGYQSLHTAVIGPDERIFEVQIRTFDMHNLAEMGVAAHWKYKEGHESEEQSYERKIAWLRQVLSWHREMANQDGAGAIEAPDLDERIYVFTPQSEVLDLPRGATVLDFAYELHTEIGHRCRGAKVNGMIVSLDYQLKTADRVEILTAKEAKPSRDWLNPHEHFLATSKAKAKVYHWFKKQDFDLYKQQGASTIERELKAHHYKLERLNDILNDLACTNLEDLYVNVGRGDIKISQILHRLQPNLPSPKPPKVLQVSPEISQQIVIEGVGHLLTHFAKCCQPMPGDKIVGFMTLGRGVSIHKNNCNHVVNAPAEQQERFLQASWGNYSLKAQKTVLKLHIDAYDRPDLLKDLTQIMAKHQVRILSLQTRISEKTQINHLRLSLESEQVDGFIMAQKELDLLTGVIKVRQVVI
jgi:GTP pyrophosphokinase